MTETVKPTVYLQVLCFPPAKYVHTHIVRKIMPLSQVCADTQIIHLRTTQRPRVCLGGGKRPVKA